MALCLSGDGAGRRLVGRTLIKQRQLAALGWRLLVVPFYEWEKVSRGRGAETNHLDGDCGSQCDYLRERLEWLRAGAAAPPPLKPSVSLNSEPTLPLPAKREEIRELNPPKKGACFPFLLKGAVGCSRGDLCAFRHLTPEDDAARALRVGQGRGEIMPSALSNAVTHAPKELMLRFFAAWGEQMDRMMIGNIWNKLGQQLRDDGGRQAWVVEHGEVLARLRRRSVEVLPEWQTPEWLGNV